MHFLFCLLPASLTDLLSNALFVVSLKNFCLETITAHRDSWSGIVLGGMCLFLCLLVMLQESSYHQEVCRINGYWFRHRATRFWNRIVSGLMLGFGLLTVVVPHPPSTPPAFHPNYTCGKFHICICNTVTLMRFCWCSRTYRLSWKQCTSCCCCSW